MDEPPKISDIDSIFGECGVDDPEAYNRQKKTRADYDHILKLLKAKLDLAEKQQDKNSMNHIILKACSYCYEKGHIPPPQWVLQPLMQVFHEYYQSFQPDKGKAAKKEKDFEDIFPISRTQIRPDKRKFAGQLVLEAQESAKMDAKDAIELARYEIIYGKGLEPINQNRSDDKEDPLQPETIKRYAREYRKEEHSIDELRHAGFSFLLEDVYLQLLEDRGRMLPYYIFDIDFRKDLLKLRLDAYRKADKDTNIAMEEHDIDKEEKTNRIRTHVYKETVDAIMAAL